MNSRLRQARSGRSFLRRADPRTKLLVSVAASAGLMLALPQLAVMLAGYLILITTAGLRWEVVAQLRRSGIFLIVLFAIDWVCISFGFAVLIALRLALLVTSFTVFFATTTPDELQAALEYVRLPARLAFTFATAYRFVGLFGTEWHGIVEAQRARGIVVLPRSWRGWREPRQHLASAVALVVPAVVLATQRAWSINEAAAARGFDSPHRSSSRPLRLTGVDHVLLTAAGALWVGLLACR
jgi:energy-coupling factor transport system permease protein